MSFLGDISRLTRAVSAAKQTFAPAVDYVNGLAKLQKERDIYFRALSQIQTADGWPGGMAKKALDDGERATE